MLNWSLLNGHLVVAIFVLGAVATVALLSRVDRAWWTRVVPVVLAAVVLLVAIAFATVTWLWRPFPDALPLAVWLPIGIGVAAIVLAAARAWRAHWWTVVGSILAALLVVVASAEAVNVYIGQYPTLRAALALPQPDEVGSSSIPSPTSTDMVTAPPGVPMSAVWNPHGRVPPHGALTEVSIPGVRSHFPARKGWVYVPPAYLMSPRPELPVLVLVNGQPGEASDWLNGGRLVARLDHYAAEHDGLAPVVVLPDDLGSFTANPMCLDSRRQCRHLSTAGRSTVDREESAGERGSPRMGVRRLLQRRDLRGADGRHRATALPDVRGHLR